MERESMVFYRSFYEVIQEMKLPGGDPDTTRQLKAFTMLMNYGFFQELPPEGFFNHPNGDPDETMRALFILARPLMDKNQRKFEAGKKGGRPPKGAKPSEAIQQTAHGDIYIPADVAAELQSKGGDPK